MSAKKESPVRAADAVVARREVELVQPSVGAAGSGIFKFPCEIKVLTAHMTCTLVLYMYITCSRVFTGSLHSANHAAHRSNCAKHGARNLFESRQKPSMSHVACLRSQNTCSVANILFVPFIIF